MIVSRRRFLHTCAFVPFLSLKRAIGINGVPGSAGPCNCVNILLHGLFFMEFQKDENQNDMLVIASPHFDGHLFRYREHGGQLQPLPIPTVKDLRKGVLPGSKTSFPRRVLHFSKHDIGIQRNYFIDLSAPPGTYDFLLKLPAPKEIIALRRGRLKDLFAEDGSVIASIRSSCGKKIGLVTRLKYEFTPGGMAVGTTSYYAEHCHAPSVGEVDAALDAARKVFGKEFDLTINGATGQSLSEDLQSGLPDEISPDDEDSLDEINPCVRPSTLKSTDLTKLAAVEIANCPNFGVS